MPNSKNILLVEDEPEIRDLVRLQLQSLGYSVDEAGDAETALRILEHKPAIDLLLTDVMLSGGRNGVELAAAATRLRPTLAVLFMSGYPEAVLLENGYTRSASLLRKPFRKAELAERVRLVLGLRASRRSVVMTGTGESAPAALADSPGCSIRKCQTAARWVR